MKLMKYTFRTPLFGSIDCDDLLSDTNGHIELSPEQMYTMYDQGPELLMFLSENAEDLTHYVPEELGSIIVRAEFGDLFVSGKLWLRTYIWSDRDLSESEIESVEDWITGQLSDGWGEGLEQRSWKEERVHKPVMYFDEGSCEFEEDYEDHWVSYYVHPWNSYDSEVYLEDAEEVEEDLEFEVVATMNLSYHNRQVVKLKNGMALRMFLKDFGLGMEFAQEIEDSLHLPEFSVYLVRDMEGNSGVEVLHKWVCEHGNCCFFHDATLEDDVKEMQMPVIKAILEMLK